MILLNERLWRAPNLETTGEMTTSTHAASEHRVKVSQPSHPPAPTGGFRLRRDPGFGGAAHRRRSGPRLPLLPSGKTAASAYPARARAPPPLMRNGQQRPLPPPPPPPAPSPPRLRSEERSPPPRTASPSGRAAAPVNMAAAGERRRWCLLWAAGNSRAAASRSGLGAVAWRAEGGESGGLRRREKGGGERRAALRRPGTGSGEGWGCGKALEA